MPDGDNIEFWLSGGAGNTDPDASLGGARSTAQRLDHALVALTAAMTVPTQLTAGAEAGNPNGFAVGDWIMFVTGANSVVGVSRLRTVPDGSGVMDLDFPLPSLAASGDDFRVFKPNNLFDDVSATECAAGVTDHRMLFARNATGSAMTDTRVYFQKVDLGDAELELAADDNVSGSPTPPSISVDTDDPDISSFGSSARFEDPGLSYAGASQPFPGNVDLNNLSDRPIWVKRVVPSTTRGKGPAVFAVVMESTNTGQDPDPLRAGALIVFDYVGVTLDVTVDREVGGFRVNPAVELPTGEPPYAPGDVQNTLPVGGGSRHVVNVVTAEDGAPVPDVTVRYSLTGPGAIDDPGPDLTDDNGQDVVVYAASTDQADAGSVYTLDAEVI